MTSFLHELRQANPNARKPTPDQKVSAFKKRVRAANNMGATSVRLTKDDMCAEVQDFISQEGFQLFDEISVGCGRNIFDERDPDCPCCELCTNRERVTHKRVGWKEE